MDFKTRFQGKTTTISKDGSIDTAILTTKAPINKIDSAIISYQANTSNQEQLITYGGSSTSNGFGNGVAQQKQFQTISMRGTSSGSNTSGQVALYSGAIGNGIASKNYQIQSNSYDYANNNYQNGYSPQKFTSSSNVTNDLEELRADNIYLKGGSNMAEALLSKQTSVQDQNTQGTGVGMSIAMRMKRNREAAIQSQQDEAKATPSQNQHFNPFSQGNQKPANQDQYWASTAYSDHSHSSQVNQVSTPISTQQSQRPHHQNQQQQQINTLQTIDSQQPQTSNKTPQALTTAQKLIGPNAKPPSSQHLRKSVEKQRQSNFASVSKQIITVNSSVAATTPNNNQAVTTNGNLKRQNSYINPQNNNQQQQQAIKHRAASVSTTIQQNSKNANTEKQMPNKKVNSSLISKSNNNLQQVKNQNLDSNPYQLPQQQQQQIQGFQQPLNNLQPEQLKQQLLMMQHQMMLLQQQQQFILGGPFGQTGQIQMPPQSSPALLQLNPLYQPMPIPLPIQQTNDGQQLPKKSDIYQQFELADQKYNEKSKPQSTVTQQQISSNQNKQTITTTTINAGGSSIYKPYSVKEYKQMQQTSQSLKLGGLGANIGGEDWEKAKKKQEQQLEYARQIRMMQQQKPIPTKKREEKVKEPTAREKALEFAKNVPKPKVRSTSLQQSDGLQYQDNQYNGNYEGEEGGYSQQSKYLSEDLNGVIEEREEGGYDEYGNTLKEQDLASLQMKHEEYANEAEDGPKYVLITENREKKHISREYAGKGTAYYPNGDIYEGDFQDGIREGRGKYFYASNGDKYDGEWKQNFKHGIGKMIYNGKGEYNGYWENGRRHGEGVFTYPNGDIYSGWWKFGDKEGTGTYIFKATGMKLYGQWKGAKISSGRWIYPNGMYYEGLFENNKPCGKGKWVYKNGNQLTGYYEQKKKEEEEEQEEELEEGQEPKPKFTLLWHSDTNIAEAAHLVNSVEQ